MAKKAVMDAVALRLAPWIPTHCPVLGPNDSADAPVDGSPFLMVQYPVANTERWAVNQKFYREEGGIRLVLHMRRGSGTETMMTWIESLWLLFNDAEFSGVESKTPSSPLITDDNEEGVYNRASIVVPYFYNFSA